MIHKITALGVGWMISAWISSPIFAQEVLFECEFESEDWYQDWGATRLPRNVSLVETDVPLHFQPLKGKALKIKVEQDGHYGTSFQYDFQKQLGDEPDAIYFHYHIRLANDWNPERGGKLPGIAATYGKAGWGGRPVHGDDGWSARGLFLGRKNGFTSIGFYAYHIDMKGQYGSNWVWDQHGFQGLENNRWYAVGQYIQLNDPSRADGIARAWVDDTLVFEKTDIRFRNTEQLKIENIWINVYHGGSWTAKSDQHLYIDEVRISSSKDKRTSP